MGTRVRTYRVDTPDEVAAWSSDEMEAITDGWAPLTSDRLSDGSLRVTYGQLPDSVHARGRTDPPNAQVAPTTTSDIKVGLWATLLAVAAIVTTFAVMARL
jgi:hypothetical protein